MTLIDSFCPLAFVVDTTTIHVLEIEECCQRLSKESNHQHFAIHHQVLRQYTHFVLVSIGLFGFTHFSYLGLASQS